MREMREIEFMREKRVFERLVPMTGEKAVEPMDFLEKMVEKSDDRDSNKKKCRRN
jgi:hypothetical protein